MILILLFSEFLQVLSKIVSSKKLILDNKKTSLNLMRPALVDYFTCMLLLLQA